ncbi:histidine kinase dimerization/phospho-acceptor domain-containing protein, partial [Pelomonas sp. KK5]|uniref:histidine kinase dimerization/phospho-acceptor domain-containing protein n=1 Tax=Pelomonas sp. KK5 TaxID=1855730 RepID=UPI0009F9723B
MDGLQGRLMLWISVAILLAAALAGRYSYLSAFDEAHELQDDVLRQVADTFDRHHLKASDPGSDASARDRDDAPRVLAQFLPSTDAGALPLPADLRTGMHTLKLRERGAFRVFVKQLASGERLAVAQDAGFRDDIARDNAKRTVMPFLLLAPLLLLLVAVLVRRIFRPVARLAQEIEGRSERELHPMPDAGLSAEIRPFVTAINRLLGRVSASMQAQQRFVADAAHELRSPLTAMSLQAERLAGSEMSAEAAARLHTLRQGIDRGRRLLEQLLSLARAQAVADIRREPVSVPQAFRDLLEDLMPLAEAKGIDLGVVEGQAEVRATVAEADLQTLLRNLVDNAIRYTPAGGRID